MKSTIIEGIPDSKIKRLKKHLLKVEELTGRKLRRTPRFEISFCPIVNFCPNTDRRKNVFWNISLRNELIYTHWGTQTRVDYPIYKDTDSLWWSLLPTPLNIAINVYIQQWIKEGKKL